MKPAAAGRAPRTPGFLPTPGELGGNGREASVGSALFWSPGSPGSREAFQKSSRCPSLCRAASLSVSVSKSSYCQSDLRAHRMEKWSGYDVFSRAISCGFQVQLIKSNLTAGADLRIFAPCSAGGRTLNSGRFQRSPPKHRGRSSHLLSLHPCSRAAFPSQVPRSAGGLSRCYCHFP